jgi:hypothetical protein
MLKNAPWKRPAIKAETCRNIKQQIKALCNKIKAHLKFTDILFFKCCEIGSHRYLADSYTYFSHG